MCTPIIETRASKEEVVIIEGLPSFPTDEQQNSELEELFN